MIDKLLNKPQDLLNAKKDIHKQLTCNLQILATRDGRIAVEEPRHLREQPLNAQPEYSKKNNTQNAQSI